jgi:serine/threonine-protein kinase HipA
VELGREIGFKESYCVKRIQEIIGRIFPAAKQLQKELNYDDKYRSNIYQNIIDLIEKTSKQIT